MSLQHVSFQECASQFPKIFERISKNHEIISVHKEAEQAIVMLDAKEYNSLMEALYLLSDPAKREYLDKEEALALRNREADEAWEEYKTTGQGVPHEVMLAWFDDLEAGRAVSCPEPQQL